MYLTWYRMESISRRLTSTHISALKHTKQNEFNMDDFSLLHDFEGRDVQPPPKTEESASDSQARGRILLSMVGTNGMIYHAVVLLPASYLVRFSPSYCDI